MINTIKHFDLSFKIIIVGDSFVGKTNILSTYIKNTFDQNKNPTIFDLHNKNIKIKNKIINFQIWDTAGQERYKSIICGFYKNAKGAFIVYDITDLKSFLSVDYWFIDLKNKTDAEIILIGNKCDLTSERKISYKEGMNKALFYDSIFFEVSAKTKYNIKNIFNVLTTNIYEKFENNLVLENYENTTYDHKKEFEENLNIRCC